MKFIANLIMIIFLTKSSFTQIIKDKDNKQLTILPIIYSSPETDFAFGVGSVFQFKFKGESTKSFSSQISAGAIYTLKNQLLIYVPFNLYFKENKFYTFGEIGFYDYIYPFYGIGIEARKNEEENYDVNFPKIEIAFTKKFNKKWYIGPQIYFEDYNIKKIKPNGIIESNNLTGINGGKISGIGVNLFYENRSNVYYPTKGEYLKISFLTHNKFTFSDYNFKYLEIDFAKFATFFDDGILATNVGGFFTNGETPLHRLALVGGSKKMRGYVKGRYRSNNFVFVQNEYRRRVTKKISGIAFLNFGYFGENLLQLNSTQFLQTYGFGLRYQLNKEGANLRVDYGRNNETTGFYLTFGEAF